MVHLFTPSSGSSPQADAASPSPQRLIGRGGRFGRGALAALISTALAVTFGAVAPQQADAATYNMVNSTSSHVTADALPTVQIDKGVVWTTAINGNVAYAGGQFSNVRPAGAAPGKQLIRRSGLIAFNVTTGQLITSFTANVTGVVKSISLSPDKRTLYLAGNFSAVNGVRRTSIAAVNASTGAVLPFAPTANTTVNAILATSRAVYLGGEFTQISGSARSYLAAVGLNGRLTTWRPIPNFTVRTLAQIPRGDRIIAGGAFLTVNGARSPGIASLDASTGRLYPFKMNSVIQNYGTSSAIWNLKSDGSKIVGTGYKYGNAGGNFEGAFSADPNTGSLTWMVDCHGDSYDAATLNGVVYVVSHHHDCRNIGGQPEYTPRKYQHADSWTYNATRKVATNAATGYKNFAGQPAPSEYDWLPQLDSGTFTGMSQAAWSAATGNNYLVLGGEFPRVNNQVQQGLVRFTIPSQAPKKSGPVIAGNLMTPTVTMAGPAVNINWPTNWDRDNQTLTYQVLRSDNPTVPLFTTSYTTQWWNLPRLSWTDTSVGSGKTYKYYVKATDANGNSVTSSPASITTGTMSFNTPYSQTVSADGATNYWRLTDPAGSASIYDWKGGNPMTRLSGVSLGAAGVVSGATDTSARFDGSNNARTYMGKYVAAPTTFTMEVWFKTSTKTGAELMSFGNRQTGASSAFDRHLYLDNAGHLFFGVRTTTNNVVKSTGTYNNGAWHYAAATLSSSGMVLYVDGVQVASNTAVKTGTVYNGFWRLGGNSLGSWPSAPTSLNLSGNLADAAVYTGKALTAAQVANHYAKRGGTSNKPPVASFTTAQSGNTVTFDGTSSTDPDGTIAGWSWNFGDGTTGTGSKISHTYTTSGTYTVSLTVTDNKGAPTTLTKTISVSVTNKPPVATFTNTVSGLTASIDGSASTDPDGTIASWSWKFGDGQTGNGSIVEHTYAASGTYAVTLTVTDNKGASTSITKNVVIPVANKAPVAAFTTAVSAKTLSVNASGSTDPDGTITSYGWNFGDGNTGTGAVTTHTYTASGTYNVTLTVTDNVGATNQTTKTVTIP